MFSSSYFQLRPNMGQSWFSVSPTSIFNFVPTWDKVGFRIFRLSFLTSSQHGTKLFFWFCSSYFQLRPNMGQSWFSGSQASIFNFVPTRDKVGFRVLRLSFLTSSLLGTKLIFRFSGSDFLLRPKMGQS